MCGITGFIGNYEEEEIYKSNKFLRHRGPDSKVEICNKKFGVSFRRLAIVDQKNGQQPFYNKKKKSWNNSS